MLADIAIGVYGGKFETPLNHGDWLNRWGAETPDPWDDMTDEDIYAQSINAAGIALGAAAT